MDVEEEEEGECIWGEDPGPRYENVDNLEELRKWIRRQRFIPCDLSDDFIRRFLDVAREDVKSAARMIHGYFNARQEPGPIFRDRNPTSPTNQKLFGSLYAVPLRNLLKDGEVILVTGLLQPSNKYSLLGHLKLIALTIDYLLWDKVNKFTDLKILMDGQNFLCPALLEQPEPYVEEQAKRFQKCLPVNIHGFYMYRPPEYVKEIARIHNGIWLTLIKTPEEAASYFPATILPFEFGGCLGHLKELLDAWNRQTQQRCKFLVDFERRMINDYRRRLCHEREVKEGGKNWVQNLKLVADESEYKKRYYERMANMKPMEHPAFGKHRQRNKPKVQRPFDPLRKLRMLAEEESKELFPRVTRGKASEIRGEESTNEHKPNPTCCVIFMDDLI